MAIDYSIRAAVIDIRSDTPRTSDAYHGYDAFLLDAMMLAGLVQVITDDGDYATVPGIRVFTANLHVIEAARTQGKLVQRPPV